MEDVITIAMKEFKELFALSKFQDVILRIILLIGVLGVALPYYRSADWLDSPITILYWLWFSGFLIVTPTANSLIREKNSNTLSTLLTSRLSIHSIIVGKLIANILYVYLITLLSILLGIITINLLNTTDTVQLYNPFVFWIGNLITLFFMCIVGECTILLSIKVKNGTKLTQLISSIMLSMFILVYLVSYSYSDNLLVSKKFESLYNGLDLFIVIVSLGFVIAAFYCLIIHKATRANLLE